MQRIHLAAGLVFLPMLLLVGCSADDGGTCRTDNYPASPADASSALHVSAGCPQEGANGTPERPYPTVSEALAAASARAAVLIAPGTYAEHLNITQSVVLVGSSDAEHADAAAAVISAGPGPFLGCEGKQTSTAINICDADGVTLRGIRVSNAVAAGIKVSGSEATIEGSVVENTAQEGNEHGYGIVVANAGSIILQNSAVTGSAGIGVYVTEASAIILQSAIRDNIGSGLWLDRAQGEVQITGNVIENNTQVGIGVFGSRAIILQNQIRGTRLDTNGIGDGVLANALSREDGSPPGQSDVELEDNEISGNARVGALFTAAAKGIILQRNTIADNAASAGFGAGVWLQGGAGNGPTSRIADNEIKANKFVGIGVTGDTREIILQNNRIVDTTAKETFTGTITAVIGDGIGLFTRASAAIRENRVSGSGRFGLIMDTADGQTTVIESNTFEQNDDSAIILQNQTSAPPTDSNTFDIPNAVRSVPQNTFGVHSEEFSTETR